MEYEFKIILDNFDHNDDLIKGTVGSICDTFNLVKCEEFITIENGSLFVTKLNSRMLILLHQLSIRKIIDKDELFDCLNYIPIDILIHLTDLMKYYNPKLDETFVRDLFKLLSKTLKIAKRRWSKDLEKI